MIAAWWLQATVISTALALAAWALDAGFAALGIPRRWAWVAAMAATVGLTVLGPFRQPSGNAAHQTSAMARTTGDLPWLADLATRLSSLFRPDLDAPLLALWVAAALLVLAILLLAVHRATTRARRGTMAMLHGTSVRVSPTEGPMIVGLRRPEIVVPTSLLQRSHAEVRLVLAHEHEHLAAGDPWLLAATVGMVALLPGLPALWWMRARLRLAIEIDCDHRVLVRHGDHVAAYGGLLLALASRRAFPGPIPLGLSLHPSSLERRIIAMTARPTRRWIPLLVVPITLGVMVACNAPMPTTEQPTAAPTVRELQVPTITLEEVPQLTEVKRVAGRPLSGLREAAIDPRVRAVEVRLESTTGSSVEDGSLAERTVTGIQLTPHQ